MRLILLAALALIVSVSPHAQTAFLDLCRSQPSDFDTDAMCGCTVDRALEAGISPQMLDAVAVVLDQEDSLDPADISPEVLEAGDVIVGLTLDCALRPDASDGQASSSEISPVERESFTVGGTPVPPAVAGALGQQSSRFVRECSVSPDVQGIPGVSAGELCQCVAEESLGQGVTAATLDASLAYETPEQVAAAPLAVRNASDVAMRAAVQCARAIQTGQRTASLSSGPTGVLRTTGAAPADVHMGQGEPPVRAEQRGTGAPIRIVE